MGQVGSIVHVPEIIGVKENIEVARIDVSVCGMVATSVATGINPNEWEGICCAGGSSKHTTSFEHTTSNDSDGSRGVKDRHFNN